VKIDEENEKRENLPVMKIDERTKRKKNAIWEMNL